MTEGFYFDVYLRDTENESTYVDQETYFCEGKPEGNNLDKHLHIWEEGNFACDCNRLLFMYGTTGPEEGHWPCGHKRVVIDKIVIRGTERVVYSEND